MNNEECFVHFIVNFNKFTAITNEKTHRWLVWLKVDGLGIFMLVWQFYVAQTKKNEKKKEMDKEEEREWKCIVIAEHYSVEKAPTNHLLLLTNENIPAASTIKNESHVFETVWLGLG